VFKERAEKGGKRAAVREKKNKGSAGLEGSSKGGWESHLLNASKSRDGSSQGRGWGAGVVSQKKKKRLTAGSASEEKCLFSIFSGPLVKGRPAS